MQTAYPVADVAVGGWTPAPLWSQLDDSDDATFVERKPSTDTSVWSTMEVRLAPVATPDPGDCVFRLSVWETENTNQAVEVRLVQGTTDVALLSLVGTQVTTTPTVHALTLTAAQRDVITDWADLRLRVSVRRVTGVVRAVRVGWLHLETPDPAPTGPPTFTDLYGALDFDATGLPDRELVVDQDCVVDGPLVIHGRLRTLARFDRSNATVTIDDPQGEARWINEGHHVCSQPDPAVNARTYFVGIDEGKYVGGDEGSHTDPGYSDHGAAAVRELHGAFRRRRTRALGPMVVGQTQTTVEDAAGWQVGDRIVVACTRRPAETSNFYKQFDDVLVTDVVGNLVHHQPLVYDHPSMRWEPIDLPGVDESELVLQPGIVNLTSNVGFEGQPGHRAHVMAHHSMPPGHWSDYANRWVGPRRVLTRFSDGRPSTTTGVLGRYGEHLHHNGDSSRGHLIERGVVSETGNHGFWTHASHGVTLEECVVHDSLGVAFGWDINKAAPGVDPQDDASHSYVERNCVASYRHNDPDGPNNSTIQLHQFSHPLGGIIHPDNSVTERPVRENPWAWSDWGTTNSACFHWSESLNHHLNNGWVASGYIGWGSNGNVVYIWQNDATPHLVTDAAFGAGKTSGVKNGAYGQPYRFERLRITACAIGFFFLANARRQSATHVAGIAGPGYLGPSSIGEHGLPAGVEPFVTRDSRVVTLNINEPPAPKDQGRFDFVNTGLRPEDVTVTRIHPQTVVRIQTEGEAWQITTAGVTTIPLFDV